MRAWWRCYLALGLAGLGAFTLLPTAETRALVFHPVAVGALAAVVAGVLRNRPALPLGWWLLAAGWGSFYVGDALFDVYGLLLGADPFPSAADVFYLLGYPLVAGGVALNWLSQAAGPAAGAGR